MPTAVDAVRARIAALKREAEARAGDPLKAAFLGLNGEPGPTAKQKAFLTSTALKRVLEGGNRSGKTYTNILDFCLQARGIHPVRQWKPRPEWLRTGWLGWYATVSYEMFGLMGWMHFKRLLLLPGESAKNLPTRHIEAISWNKKNPEIPDYICIKRDVTDANKDWPESARRAHAWFKSYEQGAGSFQSGAPDAVGLDEECADDIWKEVTMRLLDRSAGVAVSATPVQGEIWLQTLREQAEDKSADVAHFRLPTWENPVLPQAAIEEKKKEFAGDESEAALRLEGFPRAFQGLVYHDKRWTGAHWCKPFDIPKDWTRFRWIDPGYSVTACLWLAVAPGDRAFVFYREYKGKELRIGDNAANIVRLSEGERYAKTWIDRYYCQKHEGLKGEKIIELWKKAGLRCEPSVDIGVIAAIENVWDWLKQRGGVDGEVPLVLFFSTLEQLKQERRRYRWHDDKGSKDAKEKNPVKREDDLMDCVKGMLAGRPRWRVPEVAPPVPGSTREMLENDRMRVWEDAASDSGM